MILHTLVKLTQRLLTVLYALKQQLLFHCDLAFELLKLEVSIVVDVVDLSYLFLKGLKLLVKVVDLGRVGLSQLL